MATKGESVKSEVKREVKVIKKQVTKENKAQEQNGNQNGNTNNEAEMTIKLPTKKSGAKTETNVEVERKTLSDGTIEEVKTTTTKTTIDGRTEIKTRTETTIIPKEEDSEEEIVEEEEEEEAVAQKSQIKENSGETETVTITESKVTPKENGNVSKTEERSESTIIQKIAVVQEISKPEQSSKIEQQEEEEEEVEDEDEEEEEVEEAEPVTIVLKKQTSPEPKTESKLVEEEIEAVKEEVVEEEEVAEKKQDVQEEVKKDQVGSEESEPEEEVALKKDDATEQEEEDEDEETEKEKQESEVNIEQNTEVKESNEKIEDDSIEEPTDDVVTVSKEVSNETEEAIEEKEQVAPLQENEPHISEEIKFERKEEEPEKKPAEFKVPLREPSIPLDKVEDVEIKPIGISPIITKTHTENTEIITSTIDPTGGLSKQTEYNKIENIITVNRTTKILDQSYENLTHQGIPIVKTYFPPPSIDRFSTSPRPSKPYQPVYPSEPVPERRHSLLLERLSTERQMPSDIYQYGNQSYEQTQYQGEPQSEVLSVSNVKPSTITNQQWYQQTKQNQNVLYNNVTSNATVTSSPWAQPKSPQPPPQYQPQQQYQSPTQPQPQYQAPYQPPPSQFQRGPTPQSQYQRGTTPQPQFQKPTPQHQYQSSHTDPVRDKTPIDNYSSYTPKPSWVSSTLDVTPTPYSYLNKDTSQSYQNSTINSTTQYSTGYVPPPWEQDSSYTSVNNTSEKYYQEVSPPQAFSPTPSQGWKISPPHTKFTKNTPIAYVPPAPNQSFVKSVVEVPRHPGRKTYYSEYERRYITVPESTYIPTETKFQPQPDPSPQYYYDNNEPSETVEPEWRKELREFTEKTSQTQTIEHTNIQPPWEVDPKYGKTPSSTYTPTPTWSQTLRPQSNRERSFESEFVSQEWPKTNTLGRRRPLSTMSVSTDGKVTDRVRGVSVDRYNPNNYQQPEEHPPVQTHTLTTPVHGGYHNPNVPAYHTRASAEPREQSIPYQQRVYREARASPLQSRSFKYLQWITGTEN